MIIKIYLDLIKLTELIFLDNMKHFHNDITENLEEELRKIRRKIIQNNGNVIFPNFSPSSIQKLEYENINQTNPSQICSVKPKFADQDDLKDLSRLFDDPEMPSVSNLQIFPENYISSVDKSQINFPIRKIKTYNEYEKAQNMAKCKQTRFANIAKLAMNSNNSYMHDISFSPFELCSQNNKLVFGKYSIINSNLKNEFKNSQQPETTKWKGFKERHNLFFIHSKLNEDKEANMNQNHQFENNFISNNSYYPKNDRASSKIEPNSGKSKHSILMSNDIRKHHNGKGANIDYSNQNDYSEIRGPCRHCGRSFQLSSLNRHERICLQVFFCKRQKFDSSQFRISTSEQRILFNKSKSVCTHYQRNFYIDDKKGSVRPNAVNPKNNHYQISKNKNRFPIKEKYLETQERIECPYCLRKFNPTAGNRHIPFCMNRAKIDKIKRIKTIVQK